MILIICLCASAGGTALLWAAIGKGLSIERFLKPNFRGTPISGIGGVPIVVVCAVGSTVMLLSVDPADLDAAVSFAGFQLAVGFGVLGFLDDVGGQAGGGGFRGHLAALRQRTVTTGLIKLIGGVLLSLMVAALVNTGSALEVLRDGALIGGGANLANLFDRAPGRSVKVVTIVSIVLVAVVGLEIEAFPAALAVGSGLGLGWWEWREQMMLGDTGVNVLGAMVALAAVVSLGSVALWAALGVVVALNLASEVVSFTKVINAVGPLRVLDRLGRPAP